MEKILKIIPCVDDYKEKLKSINPEELDNAGLWYLHGELESLLHFDKGVITNCKSLGLLKECEIEGEEPFQKLHLNDIVKCKVDGIEGDCTGFFWTIDRDEDYWCQRGLVVLDSDTEWYNDATKKYEEKRKML